MFTLSNASIQMNTGLKHVNLSLFYGRHQAHHVYLPSAVNQNIAAAPHLINIEYIIVVKRSIRINRLSKTIL